MKKLSSVLMMVLIVGGFFFAWGCTSQQVTSLNADLAKIPTPAEVAAEICPPTQAALGILSAPGVLADPKLIADLSIANVAVNAVCSAGSSVAVNDLHAMAVNGIPALQKIVAVAPVSAQVKQDTSVGLAVAQAVLSQVIAANTTPAPAAVTAPVTSPVAPVVTPPAAGTPVAVPAS